MRFHVILRNGLEAHHIVPICLGGADHPSNLAYLTPKEHAHAHLVLWKAYPKSTSIVHAAVLMNFKDGRQLPSAVAASLREANSKASRSARSRARSWCLGW